MRVIFKVKTDSIRHWRKDKRGPRKKNLTEFHINFQGKSKQEQRGRGREREREREREEVSSSKSKWFTRLAT